MNARRIFSFTLLLALVFVLGLGLVAAQNNGGNGNGNGGNAGNSNQNSNANGNGGNIGNGNQNTVTNTVRNQARWMLNIPPASTVELPQEIIDLMILGWMDEQHAYFVYGDVIEQFGAVRPFTNIQSSEAQHIATWEFLFERYGIAIPEQPVFEPTTYASLAEACRVAADAEVANFGLYDTMLSSFEPYPDLLYVAQRLRDVSEFNHLPAFENCANR